MSRQGQGYSYGPPQHDQHHYPQQPHDPYAPSPATSSSAHHPQQHPQQQQQQYYGAPYQEHHGHSLSTVSEKDEPLSSPEMSRNDRGFDDPGADSSSYGHLHEQQQQQGQFEAPYYPGWVYNPHTNSYDPDPNYNPDEAAQGQQDDTAQQHEYGHDQHQQQQQDQYEDNGYGAFADDGYGAYAQQDYGDYNAGGGGGEYGAQAGDQDQNQHQHQSAPSQQDDVDPYANDPYASDPYADDGYGAFTSDGYAAPEPSSQPQQEPQQNDYSSGHGYSGDSYAPDAYGGEGAYGGEDEYGASQEPFGAPTPRADDSYAPSGWDQPQHDSYGQQQQQQQAYDPYAPPPPASSAPAPAPAPRAAAAPPPARAAYSPPLAQQQYSSFSSFGQSADTEPPHDPYAPTRGAPQQQRRQQPAYDPYASPTLQKADSFDPYSSTRSPPVQAQQLPQAHQGVAPPSRTTALSPPPRSSSAASNTSSRQQQQQQQPAPAAAPPPRATPAAAAAAAAPPPRRNNVPPPLQATPARAQVEAAAPSPKQTTPSQMASPRTEAAVALASPPPRSRPLPASAQKQAPPPRQQPSAGAAYDVPPPRNAPPPQRAQQPQQAPRQVHDEPRAARAPAAAERPVAGQPQDYEPEQRRQPPQRKPAPAVEPAPAPAPAPVPLPTPKRAPAAAASPYAAPPPAQPVLPPSQRKGGPDSASVLRPPVARAPHQRGASAFGSDSPYGALPSGPPTSSYEPPKTVEDQIKEEDEEDELPQAEAGQGDEAQEHVPSWMQATTPTTARPPFYPKTEPEEPVMPKQEEHDQRGPPPPQRGHPSARTAPPPSRRSEPDLADDLAAMSLGGNRDARSQGPPPQRQGAGPAPQRPQQQQQGGAPPPRSGGAGPPPRGPGGAPPPAKGQAPPARAGPPPRGQPGQPPAAQARPPLQQQPPRAQQPPPQQQQQQRGPAPPRNGIPAHMQPPASPDRGGQVPQLQFQAPSPEVRPSDRRHDPYAYAGGRSSPMPMAGIEETPEPSEHEDSYGAGSPSDEHATTATTTTQAGDSQFGGDDSIVYHPHDDDQTGLTTPSSQYGGEWRAAGYDYISSGYQPRPPQQQQQQQHDPYAPQSQQRSSPYAPPPSNQYRPRDVSSRESTSTPPAPQQRGAPSSGYAPSPRNAAPSQPPAASSMARANSYDAPPSRPVDSFSPYAQPPPPAREQQQQQQPYNPYAPQQAAAPVSRPGSTPAAPPVDLGLERRTAPIASFGFGGKLVLVFPNGGRPSYGMDSSNPYGVVAPAGSSSSSSSSSPTTVHIRKLADVVPLSATEGASSTFPGPIFADGGKANAGKKRKEAVAWLSQRIGELEQEAHYARGAAPLGHGDDDGAQDAQRKVETRLLLVKLVRIMLENEGKLVGSATVDDAVRALFAPADGDESGTLPTADQLAAAAASRGGSAGSDAPFVTYGVSASNLDDMSKFLLRGERREAVAYALDNKMWAHAFIIASCVDTDCWKDVTTEFLRSELSPEGAGPGAEGREALRVAYGMFAGLGSESIHQFIPPRALGPPTPGLLPAAPVGNGAASVPLSRVPSDAAAKLPEHTLAKWQETVGMIVANRTAGDSGALTSLGDALASNGWTDAAHICYLLSPQTSLSMGFGLPGSRITLVGSNSSTVGGSIELESVQLTELVEFALSLVPVAKGHEPFAGFPHLQAFRLYHAAALADAGHASQAHKYTEAIVNTLKLATKPSPFYHPRLVAQIKALSERLGASHNAKEGGSWIARKVPRPTVNSLWSTFEGGFNKFVAGDDEPSAQQLAAKAEVQKATNGQAVGAFSHFSSIAPGSNSGTLSRTQSSTDLAGSNFLHANPPARPLSAQRASSPLAAPPYHQPPPSQHQPHQQQHHLSPGPPPVKRAPFKTHHARSSSLGAFAGYDYNPTAPPPSWLATPPSAKRGGGGGGDSDERSSDVPRIAETFTDSPQRRERERDRDGAPASARRPQFAAVDEHLHEDESGFISPMAHLTPSVSPAPHSSSSRTQQQQQQQTHRRMTTNEELADLGLGNAKSKKPAFDPLDEELEAEEGGSTPTKERPGESGGAAGSSSTTGTDSKPGPGHDDKPSIKPSKSWLGGWFKREPSPANGPGPVRANLGEKTSLYYDEKAKRWINKGDKVEAPPTIVPPPRAATASPSKALRNSNSSRFGAGGGDNIPPVPSMPPRSQTTGPPPLSRSATSADLRSDSRPPSRSGGATPVEGGARAGRRNKPKYVVVAP
ncbi:uncharacterized protein RHOBADRAFT_53749 [Rhodotorula graminis WP1]|uniref:Protein transport protein sec16 n=1 Tax=Rhodotorula graminis (strain WP1) TaxID=578459 RepID=A0A194S5W1_RHOGW|nr:uncharacterized protein RHOBADRAFT_53749 [Rhodotorula graminis WP1]KPV74811.1 hypothetical protein RHOBADRAFT_53749 [Rhodotorula graminis WP1]